MHVVIKGTVPTAYQLQSLKSFALAEIKNLNGSYIATEKFRTKSEAEKKLKEIAQRFYQEDKYTHREYKQAITQINKYGTLSYDAAKVSIEKLNC